MIAPSIASSRLVEDFLRTHPRALAVLARQVLRALPWTQELTSDDLVQEGACGLLDAAARYIPDRGVNFAAFAVPRARGAMWDAVRGFSAFSRTTRRAPIPVYDVASATTRPKTSDGSAGVLCRLALDAAAATLPPRQRAVLAWVYGQDRTAVSLAAAWGVDESRVAVIHATALRAMSRALGGGKP